MTSDLGAARRPALLLSFVVFLGGAVMMSLEILASRLLAPYFGSSVYVWGSLIGVFLAALSGGYVLGGALADRRPDPRTFAGVVFVAGALLAPIPSVFAPVLGTLVHLDLGPKVGPLVGAILLFAVPSIALGMITPFAVRLRAHDIERIGQTAGTLYAMGSAGSIAGTLATSFVLLNHLGVRSIVYLLAAASMTAGAASWFVVGRRRWSIGAAGAVLVVVAVSRADATPPPGVIFTRDTAYHRITVVESGTVRTLRLDDYPQTAVDRSEPRRGVFAYTDAMHVPLVFVPRPRRVTLLGLGGGVVAARFVEDYPSLTMSVAEIDREVVAVAARFFDVRPNARLRIDAEDGRRHLDSLAAPADVLLMDAYLVDKLPVHLATREFFALARSKLAPNGVFASNVIGTLEGPRSRLFRAIYKTVSAVFGTVYVFPVTPPDRLATGSRRNVVVVGTDAPRLSAEEIVRRARELVDARAVSVGGFVETASVLYTAPVDVSDVPVLTDDFAPIDDLLSSR